MEKTLPSTPLPETISQQDTPLAEPNISNESGKNSDDCANVTEKTHSQEAEKVVEWGGPNGRYGRLNVILGKGAYKVVWKAIDKEEGIEVAWNCCQTSRTEFNEFSDEVEILKKVRHPNIITFHDSWYANGEFVFITELMTSGTLREYIKKLKSPSIKIIRRWARQILKGLVYLHSHSPPIIHRDIKCDNIFINGSHGEVKIGDMGTAKMRFGKKYTVIGTPEFMAPEMYEEKGYSEKVDIYAFGMCLLEMVTGEYPYSECKNAAQIYKKVTQGIKPECLSKVIDKDVLSVISHCLSPELERWSARKLTDHPFLLEEPEVILVAASDCKTRLKLQVLFRGHEKHSIKFEYNRETDTAEDVVREMIEERVLAAKYQGLVCNEIHRILRELSKTTPNNSEKASASSPSTVDTSNTVHRRVPSEFENYTLAAPISVRSTRPRSVTGLEDDMILSKGISAMSLDTPSSVMWSSTRKLSTSMVDIMREDESPSLMLTREFSHDASIDDFIMDLAAMINRPIEKAQEWLAKLKSEDIMTVGDLRNLHEEDWNRLNLTVFATRIIRNSLCSRAPLKPAVDVLSPRNTGKASIDNSV